MDKRFVLIAVALLSVFAIGGVSAYSVDWFGSGYGGGYGGYGGYDNYGYGYPDYRTESFRDTTETKHTTFSSSRDRYGSESIKTIVTTQTDIRRDSRTPNYRYDSYRDPYNTRYRSSNYAPYSNWRYKEPYNDFNPSHRDSRYNYYYQPRYDNNLGYYNWRY